MPARIPAAYRRTAQTETHMKPRRPRRRPRPARLEDRYLSELGRGGTRDDMLHALCRIADQLQRIADAMQPIERNTADERHPNNPGRQPGQPSDA